jgi:ubiquinone biosynthesis protein UbiJ
MPFSALITSGIEAFSNRFLALDERSSSRRRALVGKILAIHLKPLPTCYFVVSETQIDVLGQFEGRTDCQLCLVLTALPKLAETDGVVSLIKSGELELKGDIKLAQQFSDLFASVDADIEEKISRYIGDGPAYLLCQQIHVFTEGLRSQLAYQTQHLGEVLIEEWRLAVGLSEFDLWRRDVDAIAAEIDAVSLRIDRLIS